jgi:hypothetical protein
LHFLTANIAIHTSGQALHALDPEGSNVSLPTSPSDLRNSLMLCANCDKPFEQHQIEISSTGELVYDEKWLQKLEIHRRTKYLELKNVPWAGSINHNKAYPTSAVLSVRRLLPPASSSGARDLRAAFAAVSADGGLDEEAEEQEEKKPTKASKKKQVSEHARLACVNFTHSLTHSLTV